MEQREQAARVRKLIEAAGPPSPRRQISAAIKCEVADYAHERRAQGAPRAAIAHELGISTTTLTRWLATEGIASPPSPAFRAVEIVAPPPPVSLAPGFVVHGPCGLRIEGLTLADLGALVRGLT